MQTDELTYFQMNLYAHFLLQIQHYKNVKLSLFLHNLGKKLSVSPPFITNGIIIVKIMQWVNKSHDVYPGLDSLPPLIKRGASNGRMYFSRKRKVRDCQPGDAVCQGGF